MARGDIVIANSEYTGSLIRQHYPWAAERVRVIPRGTDLKQFDPAAVHPGRVERLRAEWKIDPDQRIVLLAARLTSWKGHRVLIEAARQLRANGLADTAFVFAGDAQGRSRYVRDLDAAVAAAGLRGVVKRVGHCEDMPAALLAASLLVVPSTKPEAFGRSAVEAQALGTPVVVSDLGAVAETVMAPPRVPADRRTGWCVPPGDAAALAEAISDVLALGASARDAMASRARTHVSAEFSLDRMQEATLDVYRTIMRDRKAVPRVKNEGRE